MVHIYNGILPSHKKEWNNAICSNADGPWYCHTKWGLVRQWKQKSYDITYIWNLRKGYKWTSLHNRNTQILKINLWLTKAIVGGGARMDWGLGLAYAHWSVWIIDQHGPAIQHGELYSVFCDNLCVKIIWKRMDVCSCITGHFAIQQKLS